MNEPVVDILRFQQACNRLEIMRGIAGAPNRLMARLLRKYPAINMRDGNKNFRLFDLDKPKPALTTNGLPI